MTETTLESRLRQIAILVASVDTVAARQLLMHMPTEIAKRVRNMAADMGPIPPEERRALLAEFQKSQGKSETNVVAGGSESNSAHQELTAKAFADFSNSTPPPTAQESSGPSWTRLGVDALVRLVRTERPTVIAVVMQQLPTAQVAAVLQRLPRSATRDALRALGSLQEIDDEAMQAIDEHLSDKLRDYHHKIETELEQSRRVNELLAAAPPELKQQWASWMRPDIYIDEETSADGRTISATATAMNTLDNLYKSATITTSDNQWQSFGVQAGNAINTANSAGQLKSTASQPSVASNNTPASVNVGSTTSISAASTTDTNRSIDSTSETEDSGPSTIPFPGAQTRSNPSVANVAQRGLLQANMDRVLTLPPDRLAELLSGLDTQTILLALAGATTHFMKRFRGMLEAEDAKVLDERIRQVGPITLRQVDAAQQRLVDAYFNFVSPAAKQRAA